MTGRHRPRTLYAPRHASPYPAKRTLQRVQMLALLASLCYAWVVLTGLLIRDVIP